MKRLALYLSAALQLGASGALAAQGGNVPLPPHPQALGVDLVTALERRQTVREFANRELSLEDLSAVLWAANGVNRPDGKRTAPSAHGEQYIDVYVITGQGAWRYDAPAQRLEQVREGDFKERLSSQEHVGKAPVVLVFVADLGRLSGASPEQKRDWAHATAGTMAQNVALMAAAKNLGTGMVGGINARAISEVLQLSRSQEPLYVMPLGYRR